jgi:hypothetical protein
MIYFNVHWYKTEFGSQHSDRLQAREDGAPLSGVCQTGTDFCVNSPWREWFFRSCAICVPIPSTPFSLMVPFFLSGHVLLPLVPGKV